MTPNDDAISPVLLCTRNKESNISALLTPTYDNLTSADEVKWHQLDSLYIIIPNIFSNLHCDKKTIYLARATIVIIVTLPSMPSST